MKKAIFLLFLPLLLLPNPGLSLEYSLSPRHYADVMEFWYQKKQPRLLKPLLLNMAERHMLDFPENQLLFGAFFSELLRSSQLAWPDLREWCQPLRRSAKHACAWAAHLAGIDKNELESAKLFDASDGIFKAQLHETPIELQNWQPNEPAVIHMLWGAFMASGNSKWLNAIIEKALTLNDSAQSRSANQTAREAASSLWKYAPRHEKARSLLEKRAAQASRREKAILDSILKK